MDLAIGVLPCGLILFSLVKKAALSKRPGGTYVSISSQSLLRLWPKATKPALVFVGRF